MPDGSTLLLVIAAGWLLNLTPGPDLLCVVSSSLRHGLRAGLVAALGIVSACCGHLLAAALGLSALLATSNAAFVALQWAGAAYLVWMGLRLVRSPGGAALALRGLEAAPVVDLRRIFWRGFLTNALNPKVALFFLAFVPQFIAPDAHHTLAVFLGLGLVFILNSLPIHWACAWLAAWAAGRVGLVQRAMGWLDRAAGLLFLGFGLRLALSDNRFE